MTDSIKLAPFAPDTASVDAAVSAVATNVVPRSDGYGPVLAPVPLSLALPAECRGAIAVFSPTYNFPIYVAGTSKGLFVYKTTDQAWHEVTNPNTSYSVPPGDYWSFAVYGTLLLACSAGTPVQKATIDVIQAGTQPFADLGGNPPRARHMGVVGDFLVLAGLPDTPQSVRWSNSGNIEQWPLGQLDQEGDDQQLPDGGAVTGFAGGEYGVIFQERAIRRMTLSPDSGNVFDCSVLEENRGAVAPWCIAKVGPRIFFLDRDGFYALVIGGGPSQPIGAERVNRFFQGRVDPERVGMTVAFRDPTGERILFAYRLAGTDASDPSLLGEALLYDWLLDRWSFINTPIRFGMSAATPDTSVDSIEGSIDDPNNLAYSTARKLTNGDYNLSTSGYTGLLDGLSGQTQSEKSLQDAADGKFLGGANPYLDAVIGRSQGEAASKIAQQMGAAGRSGSGRYAATIADSLGAIGTQARYTDYDNERTRQLQAATQIDSSRNARTSLQQGLYGSINNAEQANANLALSGAGLYNSTNTTALGGATALAGVDNQNIQNEMSKSSLKLSAAQADRAAAMAGLGMVGQNIANLQAPGQTLAMVGAAQDADRQAVLDSQQEVFNEQQASPWKQLGLYSQVVDPIAGLGGSSTGTSVQKVPQPGVLQSLFGMGLAGASVASKFMGK